MVIQSSQYLAYYLLKETLTTLAMSRYCTQYTFLLGTLSIGVLGSLCDSVF